LFTLQKIPPQNFANFSEPFQRWASASSSRITGLLQLVHCIFSVADHMFFQRKYVEVIFRYSRSQILYCILP